MAAEKPALVEEVETQIAEHGTLLGRAETLAKECERAIEFEDPNFEILQLDGHILYLMTRRHMTWESVLSYETFFREEGGEEGA
jgi:hypothetical protein